MEQVIAPVPVSHASPLNGEDGKVFVMSDQLETNAVQDGRVNILMVDDRVENLLALEAILEPLGENLVRAYSGRDALSQLLRRDFAVILMDVQMPRMDGFETATLIKDRERSRHIPIIFVTAISKDQQYVFKGYSAGAVDYISKPFDADILRSKVAVFCELYRKGEQVRHQAELLRQQEQLELEREMAAREADLMRRHVEELILARDEAETARDEAENARESAERANRAKSEFISSISHELRTPLNAIIGFSKLLLNPRVGPLNEDQSQYTQDIVQSAEHLLQLINDLLDLSKIEAGKLSLECTDFPLIDVLQESLTLVREKAKQQSLRMSVELAPLIEGVQITADRRKIKQIMLNLLSNAVKFTPEGGWVAVRAHCACMDTGNSSPCIIEEDVTHVVISVEDSGIGIATEHQERIFGAFEQVDSSYARQQQGTGLGLALTRRLVEIHGGSIWLESELEKGSHFHFSLPLKWGTVPKSAVSDVAEVRRAGGLENDSEKVAALANQVDSSEVSSSEASSSEASAIEAASNATKGERVKSAGSKAVDAKVPHEPKTKRRKTEVTKTEAAQSKEAQSAVVNKETSQPLQRKPRGKRRTS
jgi:signal transduction histidine kinase